MTTGRGPGALTLMRRPLAALDRFFNRLYGWRYNPIYHSGAVVVACFAVLCVTGLYLLLFYRIGSPYASVERIANQPFTGRWIRSLHRYASDAAIVAAVVHAYRMLVQNRAWGPRALAWVSGVLLLGVFAICGWTGYVMVWDAHGQWIAMEGARLFDVLPIFSEPIGRTFVGERDMPSAFFFLNLFAHIAVPVGILLILWIHVSRLARTDVFPPRRLLWSLVGAMTVLAVVWPAALWPEADLLAVPGTVPVDLFYGFWLPVSRAIPPGATWIALLGLVGLAVGVPWYAAGPSPEATAPSEVDPRSCTGCEQCYQDCPYEAISMVRRDDDRPYLVASIDPSKCVSCGICAGSCAPMSVGPPGRSGRDQLRRVKEFIDRVGLRPDQVVVVGCSRAAVGFEEAVCGAPVFQVSCAGSLHSSVVEYLIRGGAGGVVVATCPPRDCWNREGVTWLEERLYNEREAELKDRVDRRRLRVVYAGEGERDRLAAAIEHFRPQVGALERALTATPVVIDTDCEPALPRSET